MLVRTVMSNTFVHCELVYDALHTVYCMSTRAKSTIVVRVHAKSTIVYCYLHAPTHTSATWQPLRAHCMHDMLTHMLYTACMHACTHCFSLCKLLHKTGWFSGICSGLSACFTSTVFLQQQYTRVSEVPQPGRTRAVGGLCHCTKHLCKEYCRVLCHHLYTGHWRSVSSVNFRYY
jgi:hypothetical protein